MGCWGYIRFAGKPANNLLKRFGCVTVEFCVRCAQRVRRKLAPQYCCPCDLLLLSLALNNHLLESPPSTPPFPPNRRLESTTSSSQSIFESCVGKEDLPDVCHDDAIPEDVRNQPWFFQISRSAAVELLKNEKNGTFLVRPSTQGGQHSLCTLNLHFNGKIYHILIKKRPSGRFALGVEKAGEETFSSIVALIQHFRSKRLKLCTAGRSTGWALLVSWPRHTISF